MEIKLTNYSAGGKEMTKKMVWRDKESFDFDGEDLDSVISRLSQAKVEYGGNARFDVHTYSYEDREYLFLQVEEEETDEEYAIRLKREEIANKNREEFDRREYERLQKKFGEN